MQHFYNIEGVQKRPTKRSDFCTVHAIGLYEYLVYAVITLLQGLAQPQESESRMSCDGIMRWARGEGLKKNDAWVQLRTPTEKGSVTAAGTLIEAVEAWGMATGARRRERATKAVLRLPAAAEKAMGEAPAATE